VVYDPVGGDLAEPVFRSIAWRGRYLVIGFAGGGIPALPLNLALLKGASIVGVFWGDFVQARAQGQRRRGWRSWRSGMPRARSSRPSTSAAADEPNCRRLRAHGLAPGAGQGAAGQRLSHRVSGPGLAHGGEGILLR
jgi:hypothetical protein